MDSLKDDYMGEIGVLKGSKTEIKGRISKTDAEKKILENTS
jgi:hypothetical protein